MPIPTLKKLEEETARDIRNDFEEYGWEYPRAIWQDALKFSRMYGLVNSKLKLVNPAAVKILAICKRWFLRGQPDQLQFGFHPWTK